MWDHEGVGIVLVDALVGHPTLQEISLESNWIHFDDPQNTVGACWARLVAANSSSLHTLSFAICLAGDEVLRPVFTALGRNTFLRTLLLHENTLTDPFARDVVLPSLRANSGLRKIVLFDLEHDEESVPYLVKAQALVFARRCGTASDHMMRRLLRNERRR